MWVRGDGRLVLDRACGLWHQEFAKEGAGDIDKDVSYIYIIVHCFLIKRKWMENIVFLKSTHPSFSPIKEGSTSTPFSSSQGGNTTDLRCSELLSSKDEGPKRSMSDCARWDLRGGR